MHGQGMMIKMISYDDSNVGGEGQGDNEEKLRNTEDYPFLVQ